ncbi:hypothetical protein N665_0104s0073 [Sinapis alba]|nr:hypothetical protein N665_0104s0073 [Sinapis alba]
MAVMISHNKAEGKVYESTQTRLVPYIRTHVGQESGGDDDDDDPDVAPAA